MFTTPATLNLNRRAMSILELLQHCPVPCGYSPPQVPTVTPDFTHSTLRTNLKGVVLSRTVLLGKNGEIAFSSRILCLRTVAHVFSVFCLAWEQRVVGCSGN